jgi:hypothetical protein
VLPVRHYEVRSDAAILPSVRCHCEEQSDEAIPRLSPTGGTGEAKLAGSFLGHEQPVGLPVAPGGGEKGTGHLLPVLQGRDGIITLTERPRLWFTTA